MGLRCPRRPGRRVRHDNGPAVLRDQTCTATDAEADVITYKDHKWAAKQGPTTNGGGPMGCASPTLCLFVDGVGQSYTWDGKAFSKPKVAYPSLANTMGSGAGYIACASGSTFCVVADQLGYLGAYAGGRWSPLARPFGLIAPLGAACVSPTDCIAPFLRPGTMQCGRGLGGLGREPLERQRRRHPRFPGCRRPDRLDYELRCRPLHGPGQPARLGPGRLRVQREIVVRDRALRQRRQAAELACVCQLRVVHGALCQPGHFTRYQLGLPLYGRVTS